MAEAACMMQMALVSEMLKPTKEPWSLLGYLHRPGTEDEVKGISHWVVTDLNTEVCSTRLGLILWQYTHRTSSSCRYEVSRKPDLRRRMVLCCEEAAYAVCEPALALNPSHLDGGCMSALPPQYTPSSSKCPTYSLWPSILSLLLGPHGTHHPTLLQEGRALAVAALGHLQTEASEACRIALIHSPQGSQQGGASLQARASLAASRLQSRRPKIGVFLGMLLRPGTGALLQRPMRKLCSPLGWKISNMIWM